MKRSVFIGLSHAGADPVDDPSGFSKFLGGLIAGSVLFTMCFVFYCLLHRLFSSTKRYLDELQDLADTSSYIEDMKRAEPHIILAVECYHYETRSRTVTERDPNGGTRTRVETYQERVVSYSTREDFHVASVRDLTFVSPQLHKSPLVRLECSKALFLQDQETQDAFNERMRALHEQHKHRDSGIAVSWRVEFDGYKSHLLVVEDPANLPRCYSTKWFNVTFPLGCGTCFHFYFLRHGVDVPLRITKTVSICGDPGNRHRVAPSAPPPSAPTDDSWKYAAEVSSDDERNPPESANAPIVKDWVL